MVTDVKEKQHIDQFYRMASRRSSRTNFCREFSRTIHLYSEPWISTSLWGSGTRGPHIGVMLSLMKPTSTATTISLGLASVCFWSSSLTVEKMRLASSSFAILFLAMKASSKSKSKHFFFPSSWTGVLQPHLGALRPMGCRVSRSTRYMVPRRWLTDQIPTYQVRVAKCVWTCVRYQPNRKTCDPGDYSETGRMIFHGHSRGQRIYFVQFIYLFPFLFKSSRGDTRVARSKPRKYYVCIVTLLM